VLRNGTYQREARSQGMTSASKCNKPPVYSFRHHVPALARCNAELSGLKTSLPIVIAAEVATRCRQKIAFRSNLRGTHRRIINPGAPNEEPNEE
jgi:hypothetical protein